MGQGGSKESVHLDRAFRKRAIAFPEEVSLKKTCTPGKGKILFADALSVVQFPLHVDEIPLMAIEHAVRLVLADADIATLRRKDVLDRTEQTLGLESGALGSRKEAGCAIGSGGRKCDATATVGAPLTRPRAPTAPLKNCGKESGSEKGCGRT